MTGPIILPPPPPPPAGLKARVDAMSLPDLDFHLHKLMSVVAQVRANPPVGKDTQIADLEGAFALITQAAADLRAKRVQPPPPGDVALASGDAYIKDIIAGTAV